MKALALALLLPGAALAEDRPVAPDPAACTPLLTVRKTGCSVEHAYRCADGTMLNVEVDMKDGKPDRSSLVSDADYRPIMFDGGTQASVRFGAVPAELGRAEVIASGKAAGSIDISLWTDVFKDPLTGTYSAQIEVSDRALAIDGLAVVRMHEVLDLSLNGGALRFGGWGDTYFDPESGVQFSGSSQVTAFGSELESHTEDPVALIHPGEPGFMQDLTPADCDPVSSIAPGGTEEGARG